MCVWFFFFLCVQKGEKLVKQLSGNARRFKKAILHLSLNDEAVNVDFHPGLTLAAVKALPRLLRSSAVCLDVMEKKKTSAVGR